jgi:hypothetical protein
VWLWPNLLSLDAPLVALLWQTLFAQRFHAAASAIPAVLLTATVWLIYAADRVFDAWSGTDQSPRHLFYRRNWRSFVPAWCGVLTLTALLALSGLPAATLRRGLMLLGIVAVYFGVVHCAPERLRRLRSRMLWPKEAAVGALFALGVSFVAWDQIQTLEDLATVLLFAGLCSLNCVAIEYWESKARRESALGYAAQGLEMARPEADPSNAWRNPIRLVALAVACMALLVMDRRPILGGAELASAVAFLVLDWKRCRLSSNALRVLADVALLSPVVFLNLGHLA